MCLLLSACRISAVTRIIIVLAQAIQAIRGVRLRRLLLRHFNQGWCVSLQMADTHSVLKRSHKLKRSSSAVMKNCLSKEEKINYALAENYPSESYETKINYALTVRRENFPEEAVLTDGDEEERPTHFSLITNQEMPYWVDPTWADKLHRYDYKGSEYVSTWGDIIAADLPFLLYSITDGKLLCPHSTRALKAAITAGVIVPRRQLLFQGCSRVLQGENHMTDNSN